MFLVSLILVFVVLPRVKVEPVEVLGNCSYFWAEVKALELMVSDSVYPLIFVSVLLEPNLIFQRCKVKVVEVDDVSARSQLVFWVERVKHCSQEGLPFWTLLLPFTSSIDLILSSQVLKM